MLLTYENATQTKFFGLHQPLLELCFKKVSELIIIINCYKLVLTLECCNN